MGRKALAVQADVADDAEIDRMLADIERGLGPVEVLMNNAGVLKRTPLVEITLPEWDFILQTNLRGAFIVAQRAARRMIACGIQGCIVNISSRNAVRAAPQRTHYSVSKAGISMLTKQMAVDLAGHGIRVNEVNPGLIDTDLTRAELADPAWRDHRIQGIPLRRIGTPEDVVGAALFLASEDARFITGTSLFVDGGAHIW
jgi:NAD(P)-dependent dehydrogenase (short-subunit alcohol dehydrogenase family)